MILRRAIVNYSGSPFFYFQVYTIYNPYNRKEVAV